MKRVMFVSYAFPPMAAVGGRRIVDFCKYLPRFGWETVVLTIKNGLNASFDEAQLDKIPDTRIYRTSIYEPLLRGNEPSATPSRVYTGETDPSNAGSHSERPSMMRRLKGSVKSVLRIPDENLFWVPMGLPTGLRAIREQNVSVIVSSSPPNSGHVLGSLLGRISGRPHIADFRDLWTLNHTYQYRGYSNAMKKYDAAWERQVLKRAARIVTASPGFTQQMTPHMDGSLADKLVTITNGFDYEDVDLDTELPATDGARMRLLYTGSLYSDFSPVFFLECLAEWIKRDKIDPKTVGVDFYGHCDYDYSEWLAGLGLKDVAIFHGFKPRAELKSAFERADHVLLLLSFKAQHANVIPAKLFEYLASPARLVALAPEGTTSNLIHRHQAGEVLCQPDRGKMIEILDRLYGQWKNQPDTPRKYSYIEDIDRMHLAKRLAVELDGVTAT